MNFVIFRLPQEHVEDALALVEFQRLLRQNPAVRRDQLLLVRLAFFGRVDQRLAGDGQRTGSGDGLLLLRATGGQRAERRAQ